MLQLWLKLEEKQKKDQFCQSLFGQFTTDKWLMENRMNRNGGIDGAQAQQVVLRNKL